MHINDLPHEQIIALMAAVRLHSISSLQVGDVRIEASAVSHASKPLDVTNRANRMLDAQMQLAYPESPFPATE